MGLRDTTNTIQDPVGHGEPDGFVKLATSWVNGPGWESHTAVGAYLTLKLSVYERTARPSVG
jgi:hypothetical protein